MGCLQVTVGARSRGAQGTLGGLLHSVRLVDMVERTRGGRAGVMAGPCEGCVRIGLGGATQRMRTSEALWSLLGISGLPRVTVPSLGLSASNWFAHLVHIGVEVCRPCVGSGQGPQVLGGCGSVGLPTQHGPGGFQALGVLCCGPQGHVLGPRTRGFWLWEGDGGEVVCCERTHRAHGLGLWCRPREARAWWPWQELRTRTLTAGHQSPCVLASTPSSVLWAR